MNIKLKETDSVLHIWKEMSEEDKILTSLEDFNTIKIANSYWGSLYLILLEDEEIGFFYINFDWKNKKAFIQAGYIFEKYRGNGYYKTIKNKLVLMLFEKGIHKIESCHLSPNEKIKHINKKMGFKEEGVHVESVFYKNKYVDRIFYGMVNPEQ